MLVRVYATKPDGYWWKAPSWSEGRGFNMTTGVEIDLDQTDVEALAAHVRDGYWLRYEAVEAPKAPAPKEAKK
jgi:hypothetical protein